MQAPRDPLGVTPPDAFRSRSENAWRDKRLEIGGICIALMLITWIVFGQTVRYPFINYDDDIYVYQNPHVAAGLTMRGFSAALTNADIGHWHPVTWLSHMLDCQLFGLRSGRHHFTNVVLHAGTAVLLFLALVRMTGALWRSGLVAALFAVHPLRVESVAWIAERKDVLSGFFFMLTILAYVHYVSGRSLGRYLLVLVSFAMGLMSKGMLVTLPLILLLLDYWPLQGTTGQTAEINNQEARESSRSYSSLILEKIPLFLLSIGSCVATNLSPEKVAAALREPFLARIGNAIVSYVIYLKQVFIPAGLTLPYFNPPGGFSSAQILLALALLVAITLATAFLWKTQPWWIVGWLWFVLMLVPVIGIVQISYYARADRYTYLPQIGLNIAVVWGAFALLGRQQLGRRAVTTATLLVVMVLIGMSRVQASYWRDSETLWLHAIGVAHGNFVAHNNLGLVMANTDRIDAAIDEYEKAVRIQPAYGPAHNNLGNALARVGRTQEAIAQYKEALALEPDLPQVHNNLGGALGQSGQITEAIAHFRKALEINPRLAGAYCNLGYALLQDGRPDEAVPNLLKAAELAKADGNVALAQEIEHRLELYRNQQPYRQPTTNKP